MVDPRTQVINYVTQRMPVLPKLYPKTYSTLTTPMKISSSVSKPTGVKVPEPIKGYNIITIGGKQYNSYTPEYVKYIESNSTARATYLIDAKTGKRYAIGFSGGLPKKIEPVKRLSVTEFLKQIQSRYPKVGSRISKVMSREPGISIEKVSMLQFKFDHPEIQIPKGAYGDYDIVTIKTIRQPYGTSESYRLEYSPIAKHKIRVAGSIENYNIYLQMVRDNAAGLVAAYSFSGGKGVGPWGIVPSMGVDLAMASTRPGITGASEREEILIRYLNKVKGGKPESGPTWGGLGMAIIENPFVQIAGSEALAMGVGWAAKGVTRASVRAAPKIIPKLPGPLKSVVPKFISATSRIGGPAEKTVLQTVVGRNFMRWATEGAVPIIETTPRVLASKHMVTKLFGGTKPTAYVDDVGNVMLKASNAPIGYIDDFSRVILYKPKRTLGFLERRFVSPEIANKYAELLKKGVTQPELDFILRGELGEQYPWAKLQAIAEQSGYKKSLGGVKYPYKSKTLEVGFDKYSPYVPEYSIMTETEAAKQALLKGKIPGMEYGSLYNVQSGALRELGINPKLAGELLPEEYLTSMELPGKFTIASKKLPIEKSMYNIWAGKRWNPFTGTWDDIATQTLLPGRIVSAEEEAIISTLKKGGSIFGKGKSFGSKPGFLLPSERLGIDALTLSMFFRPELNIEQKRALENLQTQFVIPRSRSEIEDLLKFWRFRETLPRKDTYKVITPIQQQRRQQVLETVIGTPYSPEVITIRDFTSRPPPRKTPPPDTPPFIPYFPIPPIWFPFRGGKVAAKGRVDPYFVQYINEYEMMQRLMHEVIL